MPNIKIQQMGLAVSTSGVHMGGGVERRKLEPGEVLFLPEGDLFNTLWGTGKLELTMDLPNRPLDYASHEEARYCSPTFKPQSEEDADKMLDAHEAVMERMAKDAGPITRPDADQVDESKPEESSAPVVDVAALHKEIAALQSQLDAAMEQRADAAPVPNTVVSRRAARRERVAQAKGQQVEALP